MEEIEDYKVPLLIDDDDTEEATRGEAVVVDVDRSECCSSVTSKSNGIQNISSEENSNGNHNGDNPFSFLGVIPSFGAPSPIDPFRNHTPDIRGLYEWMKIIICIPLAAVRLVLFGFVLLVGFLATKLAIEGWHDKRNPMPRWRCRLMWITRICSRCILFCFGYQWIRRIGKPVSREIAPIVVSNHVSYTDPIFFFYELFPSIVASESHDTIPVVGTIIRAMQVIYVDRLSRASRKHAVAEIKRKASCNGFPRVMLFPEGTTTNGRALISFQIGAFIPGFPVQPVVIRYPHVHFDQSWGKISLLKLMFRMFTQFHNFMEVEYLPVIFPVAGKKKSPAHFSNMVSYAMSRALNVVQTEHSYSDLMLASRASEIGLGPASAYMVGMAKLERSFHLTTAEALGFLDRFVAMEPDYSGRVNIDNFLMVVGLRRNPFSEQVSTNYPLLFLRNKLEGEYSRIFRFFDVEDQGTITFREFLFGSTLILKQQRFQLACELGFKFCDANNRGFLSKQEVEGAMKLVFSDLTDEDVCRVFKLLDVDNDEAISWDDFKTCLERNPVLIALFGTQVALDAFY